MKTQALRRKARLGPDHTTTFTGPAEALEDIPDVLAQLKGKTPDEVKVGVKDYILGHAASKAELAEVEARVAEKRAFFAQDVVEAEAAKTALGLDATPQEIAAAGRRLREAQAAEKDGNDWCARELREAKARVLRAGERLRVAGEDAEDFELLISGAKIDLSYGRFKANCPSVERRPWLFKLPRIVLYELAHQARRTGKLPTEEEAAQAAAAAIPIEQFRIAQNSDRPQGGFISFGSHAVEQDCDQVSEEQVAELCRELGRIPTQDEVRGLYKQRLSRGELRAEEARARAEAIKNSNYTKGLRAFSEKVRADLLAERGSK